MNQFVQEFAAMLNGFPVIIINFFAPMLGALATAMIVEAATPKEMFKQLLVGYLAGAFCGPIAAHVLNFPSYTVGFVAGGSGYWGMKVYLKKKQDELLNKPPENGSTL